MSIDEQMLDRLLQASVGAFDYSLSGQLKRVGEQFRRGSRAAETPDESREKLAIVADLMEEAASALSEVRAECNKVLEKVGDSDKPVAKALRDLALEINRRARGKWAYL